MVRGILTTEGIQAQQRRLADFIDDYWVITHVPVGTRSSRRHTSAMQHFLQTRQGIDHSPLLQEPHVSSDPTDWIQDVTNEPEQESDPNVLRESCIQYVRSAGSNVPVLQGLKEIMRNYLQRAMHRRFNVPFLNLNPSTVTTRTTNNANPWSQ